MILTTTCHSKCGIVMKVALRLARMEGDMCLLEEAVEMFTKSLLINENGFRSYVASMLVVNPYLTSTFLRANEEQEILLRKQEN